MTRRTKHGSITFGLSSRGMAGWIVLRQICLGLHNAAAAETLRRFAQQEFAQQFAGDGCGRTVVKRSIERKQLDLPRRGKGGTDCRPLLVVLDRESERSFRAPGNSVRYSSMVGLIRLLRSPQSGSTPCAGLGGCGLDCSPRNAYSVQMLHCQLRLTNNERLTGICNSKQHSCWLQIMPAAGCCCAVVVGGISGAAWSDNRESNRNKLEIELL